MLTLDGIALTATGLLVGNELCIAAFVHPLLSRLPDQVHFSAVQPLALLLGRVMPFWYASVALLALALTFADHHRTGAWSPLLCTAAALFILVIVYTLAALVPINNRVAAWTSETRPADWKVARARWDSLHRARVFFLTLAFVLLTLGVLTRPAP